MKQKKDNRKNNGGHKSSGRKELPKEMIKVTTGGIYRLPAEIELLGGKEFIRENIFHPAFDKALKEKQKNNK